jgi:hypothetical protein
MTWWGRATAAAVLFIAFLGRSGGGLGPSSVCGGLNDIYVAGTLITFLAVPICLVMGVASTATRVLRRAAPAVAPAQEPPYGAAPSSEATAPSSEATAPQRRSLVARLLPGAIVVGLALFILAGPSGCVPFRVCAQGAEVARAPGSGLRFFGEDPPSATSDGASFTATFEATAPWTLRWSSTADRARLDVFTADAMQQGRYFPSLGHPAYAEDGPSGSTTINASGAFCVRVALRDLAFEAARNSYYSESRHSGPPPSSRSMSWEIAIASP